MQAHRQKNIQNLSFLKKTGGINRCNIEAHKPCEGKKNTEPCDERIGHARLIKNDEQRNNDQVDVQRPAVEVQGLAEKLKFPVKQLDP